MMVAEEALSNVLLSSVVCFQSEEKLNGEEKGRKGR